MAAQMNDLSTQRFTRLAPFFVALILAIGLAGCGVDAPAEETKDAGGAADSGVVTDAGGTTSDAGGETDVVADAGGATDASATDSASEDAGGGTTADASAADAEDAGAASDAGGTDAGGSADAGSADAGPTLKLPDCAKNCGECSKCPSTPMCVDGTSFDNDCQAICTLKAYDWPQGVTLAQGKCPACKFCKTNTKPDAPDAFCALTTSGAYVPVKQECELECLPLATPDKCESGKCKTSGLGCTKDWQCSPKSEVIKGSCGKFNICMQPVAKGGAACPVNAYQPVCSKKDGKTYATTCAMQACDLSGCYPVGLSAKTSQCTPDKMEVECGGECYDATKWDGPNSKNKCPNGCNPVCAVISGKSFGKSRTFRNGCIAKASGAAALGCDGVSATAKDKCSAELYQAVTKGGCCPDVDYTIVKQVCASKGAGAAAEWFTFRNQSEFDCLTAAQKGQWTFQYLGPCVCNCPQTSKPVCGDDGLTYQNACQAKCYNGDKFSWKDGSCSP